MSMYTTYSVRIYCVCMYEMLNDSDMSTKRRCLTSLHTKPFPKDFKFVLSEKLSASNCVNSLRMRFLNLTSYLFQLNYTRSLSNFLLCSSLCKNKLVCFINKIYLTRKWRKSKREKHFRGL